MNEPRINDRIRAREVRVIGPAGEQIGIKPLPEALSFARQQDLDLVEVAPQANPPVCRVMDFGKFKYEAAQKAKESRRKSSQVSIKEMKYRPKIGQGDFQTKTRKVTKFLEEGNKVKLTIAFRGREMHHPELGMRILDRVVEEIGELAKVEAAPRIDGRHMTMVLAPEKKPATKQPKEKQEREPRSRRERAIAEQRAARDAGGDVADEHATSDEPAAAPEPAPAAEERADVPADVNEEQ